MQSSKSYLRNLSATHWGMLSIQVIVLLIVIGIIELEREDEFEFHFIISDSIITIAGFLLAYFIPQKVILKAKQKFGLREKLQEYKKAMFVRWIILGFVSFYPITAFIMTKEYLFICSTIFCLVIFFLNKVNVEMIGEQLELTSDEQQVLTNPDCTI